MTTPITAGDREPDLVFTLSDDRNEVDFSGITPEKVKIEMWLGEVRILNTEATSVVVAANKKSIVVTREWGATETNNREGGWRIVPRVEWSPSKHQTFPTMILEVRASYAGGEN